VKVHHYSIKVKDLEQSIQFYKEMFHAKEVLRLNEWNEKMVFLNIDSLLLEFIEDSSMTNERDFHICFQVDDIEKIMMEIKDQPLKLLEGPYHLSNGWEIVFYKGMNGEIIEFLQLA